MGRAGCPAGWALHHQAVSVPCRSQSDDDGVMWWWFMTWTTPRDEPNNEQAISPVKNICIRACVEDGRVKSHDAVCLYVCLSLCVVCRLVPARFSSPCLLVSPLLSVILSLSLLSLLTPSYPTTNEQSLSGYHWRFRTLIFTLLPVHNCFHFFLGPHRLARSHQCSLFCLVHTLSVLCVPFIAKPRYR